MEDAVRRLLVRYDSEALVSWLNGVSQDLLGWKLPATISMYNESTSHYPVLIGTTLSYLLFIHGLQYFLRSRKIDLRKNAIVNNYAFFHNVFMSVLSLYMFVDCALHMWLDGAWSSLHGYFVLGARYNALCDIFYWSKYLELIDTVILVLKNKELGFLQLFHHSTTGSVAYNTRYQPLWMGVWTNGFIHVFMYAHFARPLAFIRQTLTTAQIVQFFIVLASYNIWYTQYSSGLQLREVLYGNFCYLVYLYFFVLFFIDNYIRAPKKGKASGENQGDLKRSHVQTEFKKEK